MAFRVVRAQQPSGGAPQGGFAGGGQFQQPQQDQGSIAQAPQTNILQSILGGLGGAAKGASSFLFPEITNFAEKGLSLTPEEREKADIFKSGFVDRTPANPFGLPSTGNVEFEEAGKRAQREGIANLGFEAGSKAFAPFIKPVVDPIKKFLTSKLPGALTKLALPETGRVGKEAVERAVAGTGKELGEEIVDRNITGTSQQLIKRAQQELSEDVAGSIENQIQQKARAITTKPDIQGIINEAVENASQTATGKKAKEGLIKEAADLLEGETVNTFEDLLNLRRKADKIAKGKQAVDVTSTRKKLNAEMANIIRRTIGEQDDDLAKLIQDEQFFIRLKDSASTSAAKPFISKGDIVPLLIGGGFGGPLGAVGSVASAKAPFSPGASTALAQLLKRFGQGVTSPVLPKVGGRAVLNQLLQGGEQPQPQQQLQQQQQL